jgi:hypothetical protein
VVLRGGRPYSLIKLIEELLLKREDNCEEEGKLVGILTGEPYGKREDRIRSSIEIGIRRGRFKKVIRATGTFICLEDPEIIEHKEYVLSIMEDISFRIARISKEPFVEVKRYKPIYDVKKRSGLLISVVDHLLSDKTVFHAVEFLVVLSEHADSYLGGVEKACMVKVKELCPGLRDPKSIMWVADRLCEALREIVNHSGFEDQIVSGKSEGIASSYDLLRGKQDKIAEALRELYEDIGDALRLEGELSRFRGRQRDAVREAIFNTVKDMAENGKLTGKCNLCGREAGREDAWEARVREELKRMLEAYILPPPPTIKSY